MFVFKFYFYIIGYRFFSGFKYTEKPLTKMDY